MQSDATYPPIEKVTCPKVPTSIAAYWLGRKNQTLRAWSSSGSGPLKPVRVHGRLAWDVAEIRELLKGGV